VKENSTVGCPFLGAFPSYLIPKTTKGANVNFFIHSFTFRNEPITDSTQTVKKNLQRNFPLPLSIPNYLLVGDDDDLHSDCRFVCGSYTQPNKNPSA